MSGRFEMLKDLTFSCYCTRIILGLYHLTIQSDLHFYTAVGLCLSSSLGYFKIVYMSRPIRRPTDNLPDSFKFDIN